MRIMVVVSLLLGLSQMLFAQEITQKVLPEAMRSSLNCQKINTKKALTLEEVVMIALCNNPQTTIAWQSALYQAALADMSESEFFPTLSANGSLVKNDRSDNQDSDQKTASLTFSYLLYDFGKRDATLENARELLKAASYSKDNVIQAVFFLAVQGYYGLFGANAALEAALEAEKAAKESLNAAKTRYGIGSATPADTLQAQTAYSQATLNRIRAQGSVKNAQGTLANILGIMPDTPLELIKPSLAIPPESFEKAISTLMQEALKTRPDLKAAQAKMQAYRANIEAAKAEDKPSLSLSASVGYTDSSLLEPYRSSSVGLYVSVPIFNGYHTKYKVQAAQEQLKLSQAEYEKLSQDIALEVYQTYQTLFSETSAVRTAQDLVASAQASYKLATGRYKAGVGTILDLLNAQSALASAQQQYIQSLYTWYITKANLAKTMGKLDFSTLKGYE